MTVPAFAVLQVVGNTVDDYTAGGSAQSCTQSLATVVRFQRVISDAGITPSESSRIKINADGAVAEAYPKATKVAHARAALAKAKEELQAALDEATTEAQAYASDGEMILTAI